MRLAQRFLVPLAVAALAVWSDGLRALPINNPVVGISPSSVSVDPGGTISVDITYAERLPPGSLEIYRVAGSVFFDASALVLMSAQPLGSVEFRTCQLGASGRVDFDFTDSLCSSPSFPIPNGSLCRLTFRANATQTTRIARPLGLSITSCNDGVGTICKRSTPLPQPSTERACSASNGSITVRQALFASDPVPGSRIELFAPLGGSNSANLVTRNDGTFSTAIDLNGQAPPLSLLPDAFGLAPAEVRTVQVGCAPTRTGSFEQVITTAVSNDPDRASASYTVACTATLPPERDVEDLSIVGNDDSFAPRYDASGRYMVFESRASNLASFGQGPLPDNNSGSDIFLLDTQGDGVVRISVDTNELEMQGGSIEPSVAANGQQVVFVAPAAAAKTLWGESKAMRERRMKAGGFIMLMRNLITGTTQAIGGIVGGVGTNPIIAPDSGSIAYTAFNTDPAQGYVGPNVYVSQLESQPDGGFVEKPGSPFCVTCKAIDAGGTEGEAAQGDSGSPVLSADGQFVAFETRAKNLLSASPSPCPAGGSEVMLRNLLTGVTQRMSPPTGMAAGACGLVGSSKPSIDYSGRKIAFESDSGVIPGAAAQPFSNVFLVDAATAGYMRVSESADGIGANGASGQASISGDGRSVAFVSSATNLDDDFTDSNGLPDVHARRIGVVGVQRLSLSVTGNQANASMRRPALSYNGARVAFDSGASNLVFDDVNDANDVFQRVMPANADVLLYSGFE